MGLLRAICHNTLTFQNTPCFSGRTLHLFSNFKLAFPNTNDFPSCYAAGKDKKCIFLFTRLTNKNQKAIVSYAEIAPATVRKEGYLKEVFHDKC